MIKRKLWLPLTVGVLFIFILFKFCGIRTLITGLQVFDAMPERCALAIEIHEPVVNIPLWRDNWNKKGLDDLGFFRTLQNDFKSIKKIFEIFKNSAPALQHSNMLACMNTGKGDISFTYIFDIENGIYDFEGFLKSRTNKPIQKFNYKGHELYELEMETGQLISLSKYQNLILVANLSLLVEESLEQLLHAGKNVARSAHCKAILHSKKDNADISAYFNFEQFTYAFSPFTKQGKRKEISWLKSCFHWLRLDFDFEGENVFNDAALLVNQESRFFDAIAHQHPKDATRIQEYVPDNATVMFSLGVKNINNLYKRSRPQGNPDFEKYLLSWMDGEIAYVLTEPYSTSLQEEKFAVVKAKDIKNATYWLKTYTQKTGDYQESDYLGFEIHQLEKANFLEPLFDNLFEKIVNPYFSFIGDYVVFCNSRQALEIWIDKYIAGQTLSRSVHFMEFYLNEANLSPLLFYINTENILQLLKSYTRKEYAEELAEAVGIFKSVHTLAMIIDVDKSPFPSRAYYFSEVNEQKHNTILWKTKLADVAIIPPKAVLNPATGRNAVLVQDAGNVIYFLNQEGEILWQQKLESKVLSDFYEVDYYENGQLQYLFNTSRKIYLLNSDGEAVGAYPIGLHSPATNGLLKVDFDENRKYKMYLACKNGNLYGYEKNGAPLPGWNPCKNAGRTYFPLKHFLFQQKDYIFGLNEKGNLFAYNRFGESRFPPVKFRKKFYSPPGFQILENEARLVVGDHEGFAHVVKPDGAHFKLPLGLKNGTHSQFAFENIVGDERNDYIVLHKDLLGVYAYKKSKFNKVFTKTLNAEQDELFVVDIPRRVKALIGTVSKAKKQISLFNGIGETYPDFPMAGTTPFSVTDLFNDRSRILIVGNENHIYAYKLR